MSKIQNLLKRTLSGHLPAFIISMVLVLTLCVPVLADGPADNSEDFSTGSKNGLNAITSVSASDSGWNTGCFKLDPNLLTSTMDKNRGYSMGLDASSSTIFSDGFEGSFPGANWEVYYSTSGPAWATTSYKNNSGSKSVWCAGSSYNPATSNYPPVVDTWIIAGPIDLSDVTDGKLDFYAWIKTQLMTVAGNPNTGDVLWILANTSGIDDDMWGYYTSQQKTSWQNLYVHLNDWYHWGNLCGQSSVYFAFAFITNGDATTDKGIFMDDITITVSSSIPPAAPSELQAEARSSKQVDLTWSDNSSNETGFYLERSKQEDSGFKQIAKIKAGITEYTDKSGLTATTDYFYRIRSYNSNGQSEYSDVTGVTTLTVPPSPPTLVGPKNGVKKLDIPVALSWNEPTQGEADSYIMQIAADSKFNSVLLEESVWGDTFFEIYEDTLAWNTKYYWRVAAQDSEGSTSDWSKTWNFTTAAGPPPEAPSDLTAEALSSKTVQLYWGDNSEDETGFLLERKKSTETKFKQIKKLGADILEYLDTKLKADTTYDYQIRAYNAGGNSAYTEVATATTLPDPPKAPALVSPATGAKLIDLMPELTWKAPSKGEAAYYQVQVAADSKFQENFIDETDITDIFFQVEDGILEFSTKYYWRVRAVDEYEQESPWSSSRNFKTPVEE